MLGAFTEQHSLFFLGARTLESFRDFGILPGFAGVVVSDRYVNYFHPGWEYVAGHQACLSHLLRDYQDAAESYPGAIWQAQAQRAPGSPPASLSAFSLYLRDQLAASSGRQVVPVRGAGQCGQTA